MHIMCYCTVCVVTIDNTLTQSKSHEQINTDTTTQLTDGALGDLLLHLLVGELDLLDAQRDDLQTEGVACTEMMVRFISTNSTRYPPG